MAALVPAGNLNGRRLCYVNSAPSAVISNTTAETAFDQVFTFPSQSQYPVQPVMALRCKAWGIVSTGLLNLSLTLRARWGGLTGGIICSTGSFGLASSLTAAGWSVEGFVLITSVGVGALMEVQGYASFTSTALSVAADHMPNPTPISLDTSVSNDVVLTAQWGTATVNNQIQLRACIFEVDGP